jgi:hypothetical protein
MKSSFNAITKIFVTVVFFLMVTTAGFAQSNPAIDIEKVTDSVDNQNPTPPDFDNEDDSNGPGVPVIPAGSDVVWTYKVTNTGDQAFGKDDVIVQDSVAAVNATLVLVDDSDGDDVLSPGEFWFYQATGIALDLSDLDPLPDGVNIVDGCSNSFDMPQPPSATYMNTATVAANGVSDSDDSHYCGPPADTPPGEFEDTCKESMRVDAPIDVRNDVDILSASYDTASDSIRVCAVLCDDECMPRSQYRFHFDYDMNNGMASYLSPDDRDESSCRISIIGNMTGTTSDDTVRFVCGNNGMDYKKVTGPAESCTSVNADGEFCCTVALSSLVRDDGSTVQECDAVDIWIDAQNKGKQDRVPDTDDSDGCSKPTGPEEVVEFAVDGTPPEITCPSDVLLECDDPTDPSNTGEATATDVCDPGLTISFTEKITSSECLSVVKIERIWTASDASGNSSSCSHRIFIEDPTAPDIACIDAAVTEGEEVDLSLLVEANDNCSEVQISCDHESGLFPLGSTEVTCTATDECGNTASCSINVEVTETPQACPCWDAESLLNLFGQYDQELENPLNPEPQCVEEENAIFRLEWSWEMEAGFPGLHLLVLVDEEDLNSPLCRVVQQIDENTTVGIIGDNITGEEVVEECITILKDSNFWSLCNGE